MPGELGTMVSDLKQAHVEGAALWMREIKRSVTCFWLDPTLAWLLALAPLRRPARCAVALVLLPSTQAWV